MALERLIRGMVFLFPLLTFAQTAPTIADFWDDTQIHDIHLNLDPNDWATLRANFQANDYYKSTFSWNGLGGTVGIRSRGNGSRTAAKPNLDVNITKYDKKGSFLGISLFVLKANNQDASTIKERIAFKLFAKMGLPAPREVPARVFINDDYFGYYNIVEHEDENLLRRNFGENGGYLYEWQTPAIYNFENLGSDPSTYEPFLELKTDQDDADLQWFVNLVMAINQSSDADFVNNVSQYLNPRLYLTHVAIENVINEIDGIVGGVFGMNNFFLYRFQGSGNLGQMIVWDKDLSFFSLTRDILDGTQTNVLTRRLLAIPEYRAVYLDALAKAANQLGSANGWADQEVTREYNQIQAIATNDPNKQCLKTTTPVPCTAQDFQAGIQFLHTFLAQRAASVNQQIQNERYSAPSAKPAVTSASIAAPSGLARLVPGALVNVSVTNLDFSSLNSGAALPRGTGTSFLAVNGVRAPISAATANQVTIQVPWDFQPGTATLVGSNDGQLGNSYDVEIVAAAPVIFGVSHANGTLVSAGQPVTAGETISVYATGLGAVSQYLDPGTPAPLNVLLATLGTVTVNIGSNAATVLFAGLAPGFTGLYQVNLTVPQGVSSGSAAFSLTVANQTAAGTIDVK